MHSFTMGESRAMRLCRYVLATVTVAVVAAAPGCARPERQTARGRAQPIKAEPGKNEPRVVGAHDATPSPATAEGDCFDEARALFYKAVDGDRRAARACADILA